MRPSSHFFTQKTKQTSPHSFELQISSCPRANCCEHVLQYLPPEKEAQAHRLATHHAGNEAVLIPSHIPSPQFGPASESPQVQVRRRTASRRKTPRRANSCQVSICSAGIKSCSTQRAAAHSLARLGEVHGQLPVNRSSRRSIWIQGELELIGTASNGSAILAASGHGVVFLKLGLHVAMAWTEHRRSHGLQHSTAI